MNIFLVQDNAAHFVSMHVVYRAGFRNEVPGNTGSSHLL